VLVDSELIILANGCKSFDTLLDQISDEQVLIDITGFMKEKSLGNKQGICW